MMNATAADKPELGQGVIVAFGQNQQVTLGQMVSWSGNMRTPAVVVSTSGEVRRRFVDGLQLPSQMTLADSDQAAVRVTMQGVRAKQQTQQRIVAALGKTILLAPPPRQSLDPDEVPYVLVDRNRADGTGYWLSVSFDRRLTRSDRLKGQFCEALMDLEDTRPRSHLMYCCCEIGLIKQTATARWLNVHRSTVNIQLGRAQTWVNCSMGWNLPEVADERDALLAWARPAVQTFLLQAGAPVPELVSRFSVGGCASQDIGATVGQCSTRDTEALPR